MITRVRSVTERGQEGLALLIAETAQSTGVCDADFGHCASCLDLADTRKRFEDRKNLDTGNKFIGSREIEHLTKGQLARLQFVLDNGRPRSRKPLKRVEPEPWSRTN